MTSEFQAIADSIERELAEQALPSLAVAAAKEGEIVWEQAFGWADRENRVPATPHTPYSMASISKPITTTALMLLVQQGKLDLDAPANQYLGDAKLRAVFGDAEKATVRTLANHTSGLPLHYQFFYADEPYARPTMDETIRRYGNLVRMPGERLQYSNLGFGILDYIISRVSGKPYRDFMREQVFLPLGMFQSAVDLTPEMERTQAVRYGGDGVRYPFYDFDHPGASAIYASAHDLIRFGLLHTGAIMKDQRAILLQEMLEQMRVATSAPGKLNGFGVGWNCETDADGVQVISHSGGMGGVSTLLLVVPEHKIVVTALANAGCGLPHRVAEEMLAVLLPDVGVRRKEAREARKAEYEASQIPTSFKPGKSLTGEWRGTVRTIDREIPLTIKVKSGGDVHLQLGDQLKALLNDAKLRDDEFKGIFVGELGVKDVGRRPHRLHLDLKLRGDSLTGCIIALTHIDGTEGGAPGRRTGNALCFATTLQQTEKAEK